MYRKRRKDRKRGKGRERERTVRVKIEIEKEKPQTSFLGRIFFSFGIGTGSRGHPRILNTYFCGYAPF